MWKVALTLVAIWIALTVASYYIAGKVVDTANLKRFVDRGVQTQGIVVSKDPDNHRLITYKYDVGPDSFTGTGNGGAGNPEFDEIKIGQALLVFFDRENPQDSILGFPQTDLSMAEQMVWAITFTAPIFPVITIGIVMFVLVQFRKKKPLKI